LIDIATQRNRSQALEGSASLASARNDDSAVGFDSRLADFAASLEFCPRPAVIFASNRSDFYANRAAADQLGGNGEGSASSGGWVRRMADCIAEPGAWPREIVFPAGPGRGKWLASRLTNGTEHTLGTLLTAL
jgi:hypothetical protein